MILSKLGESNAVPSLFPKNLYSNEWVQPYKAKPLLVVIDTSTNKIWLAVIFLGISMYSIQACNISRQIKKTSSRHGYKSWVLEFLCNPGEMMTIVDHGLHGFGGFWWSTMDSSWSTIKYRDKVIVRTMVDHSRLLKKWLTINHWQSYQISAHHPP